MKIFDKIFKIIFIIVLNLNNYMKKKIISNVKVLIEIKILFFINLVFTVCIKCKFS